MRPVSLLLVEAAFLAAAHVFGGPPWTVIAAIAFAMLGIVGGRHGAAMRESLWLMLPSLVWLAAFRATGNRELFFPYTIYLAAHAAMAVGHRGPAAALLAGVLVVAVFLGIRALQGATSRVLTVEGVAAAAILAAACLAIARRDRSVGGDGVILAIASAAAYLALAL